MKRKVPLKRKTRLRPRGKTKYRRRVRDLSFMKTVLRLPCAVKTYGWMLPINDDTGMNRRITRCWGRVEADHAGQHGLGVKADDRTCIPLCSSHHQQKTDYSGTFKGMNGSAMRSWLNVVIAETRRAVSEAARSDA